VWRWGFVIQDNDHRVGSFLKKKAATRDSGTNRAIPPLRKIFKLSHQTSAASASSPEALFTIVIDDSTIKLGLMKFSGKFLNMDLFSAYGVEYLFISPPAVRGRLSLQPAVRV